MRWILRSESPSGAERPRAALGAASIGAVLALVIAPGCTPCRVFGPSQRQLDERQEILNRARGAPVPVEVLNVLAPSLTRDELEAVRQENASCRASYLWKSGFNWTGGALVGIAAGVTIGGAYATALSDATIKVAFGVSAGSLAALGAIFEAIGGLVQQSYTDRGCVMR